MATTTNMSLILPDVSVTPGPTYASQNNAAFTLVDSHDHTPGNGALIPSAGLSINADLEFNDNAATELTRSAYTSQGSVLSGTNHTQVISNELHFIDGAGNNVQITNGGALDITSSGGIGGDYTAVGASVTFTDATNTYLFRNGSAVESLLQFTDMINSGKQEWTTNAPAGNYTILDGDNRLVILVDSSASRTVNLPDPTLGKRVVIVKDKNGSAGTNNITIAPNGAENIDGVAANKIISIDFGALWLISDLTDWFTLSANEGAMEHEVQVDTGNGHGSINTAIRRFSNIRKDVGTAITYADSATLGASCTINEDGIYTMNYSEETNGASWGFSVNSSLLTTSIGNLTYAQGKRALAFNNTGTATTILHASWTGRLSAADVIRPHTNATPAGTDDNQIFSIVKIRE